VRDRVRAPRAPALRSLLRLPHAHRPVGVAEHLADDEIGRQERVGVAEPAHRNVVGGPGADSAEREQRGARGIQVDARREVEPAVADRPCEPDERRRARRGHPEALERARGDHLGVWERDAERADHLGERLAEHQCEAPCDRPRRHHRDLLAEDRAHRDLEAVDGARDTQPGNRVDERPQTRIPCKRRVDRARVGSDVEDAPGAREHVLGGVLEPVVELEVDLVAVGGQAGREHARSPVDRHDAPVRVAHDLFDTRRRAQREEAEQRIAGERGTVGEVVHSHAPVRVEDVLSNASPVDLRPELLERQGRARAAAARAGLAGVVALGRAFYDRPGPCAWLTGHHPPFLAAAPQPGLRGAGHAAFVLPANGATMLVCDPTGAREELVASDELWSTNDLWEGLAHALRAQGIDRGVVGVAGYDLLPAAIAASLARDLPGLELRPFDAELDQLRQVKSLVEQGLLGGAAACADAALARTVGELRQGASEREAAAAGTAAALLAGADHVRYLRVHSGPWSERTARWPPALERVPTEGELVMIDVIGARGGYAFDVARTILLGEGSRARRELLDACGAASDASAHACRAGATVGDVLAASYAVYASAGLASHVRTFAGHGIGIETVESPLFSPASAEVELVAGMTLCVEPGVSVPGLGGALIEHELIVGTGPPRLLCATATLT